MGLIILLIVLNGFMVISGFVLGYEYSEKKYEEDYNYIYREDELDDFKAIK